MLGFNNLSVKEIGYTKYNEFAVAEQFPLQLVFFSKPKLFRFKS